MSDMLRLVLCGVMLGAAGFSLAQTVIVVLVVVILAWSTPPGVRRSSRPARTRDRHRTT